MGFFKTLLFLMILFGVIGAAGFYGLPFFTDRYIAPLSRDIQDLSDRASALEEFVQAERAARENAVLPADADMPAVVSQINGLAEDVRSTTQRLSEESAARLEFEQRFEQRLNEMVAESNALIKKELDVLTLELKKEQGTVGDLVGSVERGVTILRAAQTLSNVMGHLVKAKSDLQSRNTGKALSELAVVQKRLEGIAEEIREGEEASVLQTALQSVRNVRQDIDESNPAALDRIDLLWNDLERLALLFLEKPVPQESPEPEPSPQ